jgi:hypothetical protein
MKICDCNGCKKGEYCHDELVGCEEYEQDGTVEYLVHCWIGFGKTKTVMNMLEKPKAHGFDIRPYGPEWGAHKKEVSDEKV